MLDVIGGAGELVGSWRSNSLVASNQPVVTAQDSSCPDGVSLLARSDSPNHEVSVAALNLENVYQYEPEVGGQAEVLANSPAKRSMLRTTVVRPVASRFFKPETLAKIGRQPRPANVEIKTFDREVTFDLPMTVVSDFKADSLSADKLSEFPLSLLGKIGRKQLHGKSENARRELILRRLDGNISLRRSS